MKFDHIQEESMTNRREFLQVGIAASVWPIAAKASPAKGGTNQDSASPMSFYKAVFDTRYQDSQVFANQMTEQNIPVHAIEGDITSFWFNELDAIWKKEPVAVVGMTAHGPLFCLEQLAWQRGMKVIYRAEHKLLPGNIIEHAFTGPEIMLAKSRSGKSSLGGLDKQWPQGVAKLMLDCPQGQVAIEQSTLMMPISGYSSDLDQKSEAVDVFQDPLISWIIAPARKA